jgi:hypothetical protein
MQAFFSQAIAVHTISAAITSIWTPALLHSACECPSMYQGVHMWSNAVGQPWYGRQYFVSANEVIRGVTAIMKCLISFVGLPHLRCNAEWL